MNCEYPSGEHARAEPGDDRLALADPGAPGELLPEQLDAWLDRLVDGEVAEPQRQALLSRLERSPGAWRRCALAFLEAQAWREALSPEAVSECANWGTSAAIEERADVRMEGGLPLTPALSPGGRGSIARHDAALRIVSSARPLASPRLAWQWRPLLGMVAAAASFALAFGLGLLVHKTWLSPKAGASGGAVATVGQGGTLGGVPVGPSAATAKSPSSGQSSGPTTSEQMKWGAVQLVVDGPEGSPEQVRLPAVDGPDPERWLREQPPAIPEEIVQELRRRGHHVETQRRYVPVPLDDGRSAVFPVDQVDVRFRGGNGYQ